MISVLMAPCLFALYALNKKGTGWARWVGILLLWPFLWLFALSLVVGVFDLGTKPEFLLNSWFGLRLTWAVYVANLAKFVLPSMFLGVIMLVFYGAESKKRNLYLALSAVATTDIVVNVAWHQYLQRSFTLRYGVAVFLEAAAWALLLLVVVKIFKEGKHLLLKRSVAFAILVIISGMMQFRI